VVGANTGFEVSRGPGDSKRRLNQIRGPADPAAPRLAARFKTQKAASVREMPPGRSVGAPQKRRLAHAGIDTRTCISICESAEGK